MNRNVLFLFGVFLSLLGTTLTFVPRFTPTPQGSPDFVGTYLLIGIPMLFAGITLAWVHRAAWPDIMAGRKPT